MTKMRVIDNFNHPNSKQMPIRFFVNGHVLEDISIKEAMTLV